MMRKRIIKYLITVGPERDNSKYIGEDGKKVIEPLAKEFYSFEDAQEFATSVGIQIDGAKYYIVTRDQN